MNDDKELIEAAFKKGVSAGNSVTLNYKRDYYNNFCFPYLTMTGQLAMNPICGTGGRKRIKAAWHNGFRSVNK